MLITTSLMSAAGRTLVVDADQLAHLRSAAPDPRAVTDGQVGPSATAALALACGSKGWWTLRSFLLEASRVGGFTVHTEVRPPEQRRPRRLPYPVFPPVGDPAGGR